MLRWKEGNTIYFLHGDSHDVFNDQVILDSSGLSDLRN